MKKISFALTLCLCLMVAGTSVSLAKKDFKGKNIQADTATAGTYGAGDEGMKADEKLLENIKKVQADTEKDVYSDKTADDK